jgi:glucokinase
VGADRLNIALGIDIGGTRIKTAVVDASGAIVRAAEAATPLGLEPLQQALGGLIRNVCDGAVTRGAGVACKGIVDPATTCVVRLPGVLGYLEGCVLSEIVQCALEAPVTVFADNDARVTLVGECVWGAARGVKDTVLITLGTGVGGAILSDGRIVRGHKGSAGHLGHLTVEADGPPCICGNRGCLESVFSARVVEADAWSAIHRGLLPRFPDAHNRPTCAEVFAAAAKGDETARWIVGKGIRKLGAAVAGLIHTLDPESVIIGGQVASAGDMLFAPLRQEVWVRTRGLLRREVPIVPVQVADPSGVIGAAAMVFEAGAASHAGRD